MKGGDKGKERAQEEIERGRSVSITKKEKKGKRENKRVEEQHAASAKTFEAVSKWGERSVGRAEEAGA